MLAMTCDWRVMATGDATSQKPFTIGLNETKLGIAAPFWFADTFISVVGQRQADIMLQTGALISAQEAHRVGLVDEAVAQDAVMGQAV